MSKKKKKKKNVPYRSVLDESPIKDAESDKDGVPSTEDAGAGTDILPEDDSISDIPAFTAGSTPGINAAAASKFSGVSAKKRGSGSEDGKAPGGGDPETVFEDDFPEDDSAPYNAHKTHSVSETYDEDHDEYYDEEEYVPSWLDRAIQYASMFLSVLLLGGSIVFWFTILRYLFRTPFALADSTEMRTLIICCACFPVIVTAVQHYLRRPISAERWLICLCTSGALAALFTVISQALIRRVGFSLSDLPLVLCCAFSGCTLPSVLCAGARVLIERFRTHLRAENGRDWEAVRRDVLSLTDFRV